MHYEEMKDSELTSSMLRNEIKCQLSSVSTFLYTSMIYSLQIDKYLSTVGINFISKLNAYALCRLVLHGGNKIDNEAA